LDNNYKVTREQSEYGRSYVVYKNGKDIHFPSVTTILKLLTEPKFEDIRKQFGEDKWKKILDDASYRGNIMHLMLEKFLIEFSEEKNIENSLLIAQKFAIDESVKKPGDVKLIKKGRDLFWNFYNESFWKDVKTVLHNELFLWTDFRGGWAGATDFVYGNFVDEHILIDFKSSISPKTEEEVESYYCQIAAYMFMYAERTGILPKRGEIWISNEKDNDIQRFILNDFDFKIHLRKFLNLLVEFQHKYNLA